MLYCIAQGMPDLGEGRYFRGFMGFVAGFVLLVRLALLAVHAIDLPLRIFTSQVSG